jgi:hypothetical protein
LNNAIKREGDLNKSLRGSWSEMCSSTIDCTYGAPF